MPHAATHAALGLGLVAGGCCIVGHDEVCASVAPSSGDVTTFRLGYPEPYCDHPIGLTHVRIFRPGEQDSSWSASTSVPLQTDSYELGAVPPGFVEYGDRDVLTQRPIRVLFVTDAGLSEVDLP